MKMWIIIGAISAGMAVALGAFGAHGLKPHISPEDLTIYETAVQYHMIHAVALLIIGLMGVYFPQDVIFLPAMLIFSGIILFSGSLYLLVLTDTRWLGAITPIGGVAFVAGWGMLAYKLWKVAPQ